MTFNSLVAVAESQIGMKTKFPLKVTVSIIICFLFSPQSNAEDAFYQRNKSREFAGIWNGERIIESQGKFFKVENSGKVGQLTLPGSTDIISIATGSAPLALVMKGGRPALLQQANKNNWLQLSLPTENLGNELKLLADRESIVLLDSNRIFVFSKSKWRQVKNQVPKDFNEVIRLSRHSTWLLKTPFLYLGLNGGEWSGGLLTLNLDTAVWKTIREASGVRVTDLKLDPFGNIWMTGKNYHLYAAQGVVSKVLNTGAQITNTSSFLLSASNESQSKKPLSPVFTSVDFDLNGSPFYLSSFGIVGNRGGKWTVMSTDWNRLRGLTPASLLLLQDQNKAVVSTDSDGPIVVELKSN